MCGIWGVSFAPESKINRRKVAAAALKAAEVRGKDASGYAWVGPGSDGFYKKDQPGSILNVGRIPENATALIGHTRYATQGHQRDNRNNHPVLSPNGRIRLVHNGVISNDWELRKALGKKVEPKIADVDTAVIPAVLEKMGIEGAELLEGDAACAWFDRLTGDTIHLAKFNHSPVSYVQVEDGTILFASTPQILAAMLYRTGLRWFGSYPDAFDSMNNGDYIQLIAGQIVSETEVEWGGDGWGSRWRAATSGSLVMGKQPVQPSGGWSDRDETGAFKGRVYGVSDDEWDEFVKDQPYALSAGVNDPIFYTMSHDGDYATYTTKHGLTSALEWQAGATPAPEGIVSSEGENGTLRWVNHFADIGHLSEDGSKEYSWVKSEDNFYIYEAVMPMYVADGIDSLRTLIGA